MSKFMFFLSLTHTRFFFSYSCECVYSWPLFRCAFVLSLVRRFLCAYLIVWRVTKRTSVFHTNMWTEDRIHSTLSLFLLVLWELFVHLVYYNELHFFTETGSLLHFLPSTVLFTQWMELAAFANLFQRKLRKCPHCNDDIQINDKIWI